MSNVRYRHHDRPVAGKQTFRPAHHRPRIAKVLEYVSEHDAIERTARVATFVGHHFDVTLDHLVQLGVRFPSEGGIDFDAGDDMAFRPQGGTQETCAAANVEYTRGAGGHDSPNFGPRIRPGRMYPPAPARRR